MSECIYKSFLLHVFATYHTQVVIYIDFDINANKLARPILPHLWGKMGHGWEKLGIDQL